MEQNYGLQTFITKSMHLNKKVEGGTKLKKTFWDVATFKGCFFPLCFWIGFFSAKFSIKLFFFWWKLTFWHAAQLAETCKRWPFFSLSKLVQICLNLIFSKKCKTWKQQKISYLGEFSSWKMSQNETM